MKPYISSLLKDMNRQVVYKLFCKIGETSKAEISKLTGISAPTVIKIINFFLEKGIVEELGEGESALGRKPQMLRLCKNRFYAIGVIHEGDYLKVGVSNFQGELVALKKVKVNEPFEVLMKDTLCNIINSLLVENEITRQSLLGIGLGLPGIYDVVKQTIITAPLIGIIEETKISHIIEHLQEYYSIKVVVENDLNMEVMGEFVSLDLAEDNDLVYISLGTGLGCGVVLNGQIRRGSHYMCGEIGYMSFLDDYIVDERSAGWLETKINLSVLNEKFNLDEIKQSGAMDITQAIEYVAIPVALCVNNIMMCYDCDHISIGGEVLDLLGEELFHSIENKIKSLSVGKVHLHMKSCIEPGIIGATSIVIASEMKCLLAE